MADRRSHVMMGMIGLAAALCAGLQTRFDAPPRFDGAGYSVLAESIRTGQGYRAIDRPDAPLHAHFPPAYPVFLALIWSLTGPRVEVAHTASLMLTATAAMGMARWLQRCLPSTQAQLLALACSLNWMWGRVGGAIQSEPLFLALAAGALNAHDWAKHGRALRGFWLGLALAALSLTRHIGLVIAIVVLVELALCRLFKHAVLTWSGLTVGVIPWALWLMQVREHTQVGLLAQIPNLAHTPQLALFYIQRIPDAIVGPFIEYGTVYRPSLWGLATLVAGLLTASVAVGWVATAGRPGTRLLGTIPLGTLALLVVWPFTEAGRFLIPLLPFILVGAWWSLSSFLRTTLRQGARVSGLGACWLLLSASAPYSIYAILTQRAFASEQQHLGFDTACAWVGRQSPRPGPVLAARAGEAYWIMGRQRHAIAPPDGADSAAIRRFIKDHGVAFVIDISPRVDRDEPSSIGAAVGANPEAFQVAFEHNGAVVYEVRETAPRDHGPKSN